MSLQVFMRATQTFIYYFLRNKCKDYVICFCICCIKLDSLIFKQIGDKESK